MIDSHCHLEQRTYDDDRDEVIARCKAAGLKAIVFSCAHFHDLERSFAIAERYKGYAFMAAGLHPEFIQEITPAVKSGFFKAVKAHVSAIVAIGETGLDYNWTKEEQWRLEQARLFTEMIRFAKRMNKPLVVHCRDAYPEAIEILERENACNVLMHMFGGKDLVDRVVANGWHVSTNAIVLRSKDHRKIVKRVPPERLLLETDAPWLHPSGQGRNEPTSIKSVAEKVAELTHRSFDDVWLQCGRNAVEFYGLPVVL